MFLQIEEYSRKQAELESKLNAANKRVSVLKLNVRIECRSDMPKQNKLRQAYCNTEAEEDWGGGVHISSEVGWGGWGIRCSQLTSKTVLRFTTV